MNGCAMQGFGNGYFGGIFPGYNMLEGKLHIQTVFQNENCDYRNCILFNILYDIYRYYIDT